MSTKNGNGNGGGNGDKLSRLQERQKEVEKRLAEEKLRLVKREQRENKKLQSLIGAAVLKELRALKDGTTENHKEAEALETILRGILASGPVAPMFSASDKKLLRAKGWLA